MTNHEIQRVIVRLIYIYFIWGRATKKVQVHARGLVQFSTIHFAQPFAPETSLTCVGMLLAFALLEAFIEYLHPTKRNFLRNTSKWFKQ